MSSILNFNNICNIVYRIHGNAHLLPYVIMLPSPLESTIRNWQNRLAANIYYNQALFRQVISILNVGDQYLKSSCMKMHITKNVCVSGTISHVILYFELGSKSSNVIVV